MDNVRTGAFIKTLRTEKKMTQKELADLLHITDRAVSKWERGLCAPDLSLLDPLAAVLGVSIGELLSGERAGSEADTNKPDSAIKNMTDDSKGEIVQTRRAVAKKMIVSVMLLGLILVCLIPTLNGTMGGDGFTWECIPAYLCAQKAAKAIETNDEQMIQTYIGNSEDMFSALSVLQEQGIDIWEAEAKFSRTRLEDMFLRLEVDLVVMYQDIKYQFTCGGTYRNGKVEFMNIVSHSLEENCPVWMVQLNDALSTYDPG